MYFRNKHNDVLSREISEGKIRHLLIHGAAGSGKKTNIRRLFLKSKEIIAQKEKEKIKSDVTSSITQKAFAGHDHLSEACLNKQHTNKDTKKEIETGKETDNVNDNDNDDVTNNMISPDILEMLDNEEGHTEMFRFYANTDNEVVPEEPSSDYINNKIRSDLPGNVKKDREINQKYLNQNNNVSIKYPDHLRKEDVREKNNEDKNYEKYKKEKNNDDKEEHKQGWEIESNHIQYEGNGGNGENGGNKQDDQSVMDTRNMERIEKNAIYYKDRIRYCPILRYQDRIEVNPSDLGTIETHVIQSLLIKLASHLSYDCYIENNESRVKPKIVVIHDADLLSQTAQEGLRRVLEIYAQNCRFFLVAQSLCKIHKALRSRCEIIRITSPKKNEIAVYLKKNYVISEIKDYIINETYRNWSIINNLLGYVQEQKYIKDDKIRNEDEDGGEDNDEINSGENFVEMQEECGNIDFDKQQLTWDDIVSKILFLLKNKGKTEKKIKEKQERKQKLKNGFDLSKLTKSILSKNKHENKRRTTETTYTKEIRELRKPIADLLGDGMTCSNFILSIITKYNFKSSIWKVVESAAECESCIVNGNVEMYYLECWLLSLYQYV